MLKAYNVQKRSKVLTQRKRRLTCFPSSREIKCGSIRKQVRKLQGPRGRARGPDHEGHTWEPGDLSGDGCSGYCRDECTAGHLGCSGLHRGKQTKHEHTQQMPYTKGLPVHKESQPK